MVSTFGVNYCILVGLMLWDGGLVMVAPARSWNPLRPSDPFPATIRPSIGLTYSPWLHPAVYTEIVLLVRALVATSGTTAHPGFPFCFRAYTDPLNSSGQSASNSLNPPSIPPPPPPPPPLNIPPSRARMAFAARLASKRKEAEEAGEDGELNEEKGLGKGGMSSLLQQGKDKDGEDQPRNPFADDEDDDEQSDDEDEDDDEGDLGRGENTSGQNSSWNRGGWWRGALGGGQGKTTKETFGDGRDSSDSEEEPEGQGGEGGNSSDEEFGDFAMPEASGNTAEAGGATSGFDADREKVLVKPMPVHPPGGGNKGILGLWPFTKKDKDNSPTKDDGAEKEKTATEAEASTEKPVEAQAAEEAVKTEEEKEATGEKNDVKDDDKTPAEPPVVLSEDGEKVQAAVEAKRRTSIEEPDEGDEVVV
ncbi:hypothetical protein Daus18300_010406 [Diaporthe australafricana]|uniref:SIT4 phosphatase-associated protein n=1 Tax=Diaporthe australafricana TaxID=127596 RepID=A0ABR3WAF7_9PEZI